MFSRIQSIEQKFRKHELEYDFEKLSKIAKELSSRKNSYTRIFRIEVQRTFLLQRTFPMIQACHQDR